MTSKTIDLTEVYTAQPFSTCSVITLPEQPDKTNNTAKNPKNLIATNFISFFH
jgi:hypothetical protein